MTAAQSRCLDAIKQHWAAYDEAPTRQELGLSLGITAVSAHLLVWKLARAGAVVVTPLVHRNVAPN